ncbi:gastrula zinc finger protein XlCGF26.1-like [Euwallacea fornicatus]|uniref:gastrula zinc finger protein XlCGF26.1-like n=1 Tax=Euwallacea fornicatus TaxID=995702 RepID=UPI0033903716
MKTGGYPCPTCDRFYKHRSSLYNHLTYECGKAKRFECTIASCNYKTKRKGSLSNHMVKWSQIQCEERPGWTRRSYESGNGQHEITATLRLSNQGIFRNMQFAQDLNGRFMCPNCNSSYKQKGHLVRHIKYECGVEPQFECQVCFHSYRHSCGKCLKSYKYKWNLLRHVKYECGVAPQFTCRLCSKAFTQKSSLKSHVAYVHGYQLTINYQKLEQLDLKRIVMDTVAQSESTVHVAIRDKAALIGQNRYSGRKTSDTDGQRNHNGIYVCHCGKSYKYPGGLKEHQKWSCGEGKKWSCDQCTYIARWKSDLTKHMKRRHKTCCDTNFTLIDDGRFECKRCKATYTKKIYLRKHLIYECTEINSKN